MALDIYDADGHLDRGRVLDELNERMRQARAVAKVMGPGSAFDALYPVLVNLLDECSEGYTMNPLTAPSMVTDYINACKRVR